MNRRPGHRRCAGLIALTLIAIGIGAFFIPIDGFTTWQRASIAAPLGADEFGRNLLITLLRSGLLSVMKAVLIVSIVFILALSIAETIRRYGNPFISSALNLLIDAIESIPAVLWVLALFVALREPRLLIVVVAFALITIPPTVAILGAELERLRSEPFVEIAYALGMGEFHILARHLIPNATAILAPYAFQMLGAAIAVDGAIGIIGLGNRTDMDLGVFLLRGKENFFLHPQVLVATLLMYALLYAGIIGCSRAIQAYQMKRHAFDH